MAAKVRFATLAVAAAVVFNRVLAAPLLSRNAAVQVSVMFRLLKRNASS
jgi:hypothetical protein